MALIPPSDFADWYRAEYRRLYTTLAAISGDRVLAEDLAAEAFARALERWPRVRSMDSPERWACTVGLNLLRRHHRRRILATAANDLTGEAAPSGPIDISIDLVSALNSLPIRSRMAFVLRYVHDLSEADTAIAMGVRRGTVAALVHQAKTALRAALADHRPGSNTEIAR